MAVPKTGPEPLVDLGAFLESFGELLRRSESREAMERYATGLLADLDRKTAAGMGRALPGTNGQRLQEFLTNTRWDWREMDRLRIAHMIEHATAGEGVVVVDDTGLPKRGSHSVGVARQYSGTLGRVDNCQVLVTTHYVDRVFDWPVNGRIYLPEEAWATNEERRQAAHVPPEVAFQTKGEIALDLLAEGREAGLEPGVVVADPGYGDQGRFLDGLEARGQPYVVGLHCDERLWLPDGEAADDEGPSEAQELLEALPEEAWERVFWREGTKGPLVKNFTRLRVARAGPGGTQMESEGWLVGERPLLGHAGDRKFYYVWGLDERPLADLVHLAHLRWIVERHYQDAKGELGLDDYEGRLWHGVHRHVALVMLAHCFLTLRQTYAGHRKEEPPPETSGTDPPEGEGAPIASSPPPGRGFPP